MSNEKKPAPAPIAGGLRTDDRLKAEDALYASLYDRGDKKMISWAAGVAVLIHVIVFLVNFPERVAKAEEKRVSDLELRAED